MSKCPACGETMRKSLTATLQDPAAGSAGRRARVCQRCFDLGLHVVAPRVAGASKEADPEMAAFLSSLMAAFREVEKNAHMADLTSRDGFAQTGNPLTALHAPQGPELAWFFAGRAEGLRSAAETFRTFASAQPAAPLTGWKKVAR